MKDLKTKPTMGKPKVLEKVNILPREAGAIMKERYVSKTLTQKPDNPTATNAAANDATRSVETNTQNAAAYTTRAAKKGVEQIQNRAKEKRALKDGGDTPQTENKAGGTSEQSNSQPDNRNTPKTREQAGQNDNQANATKTRGNQARQTADPKRQTAKQNEMRQNSNHSPPQNGGEFSNFEGADITPERAKQKFQRDRIKQRQDNTRIQHTAERKNNLELQNDNSVATSGKQQDTAFKRMTVKDKPQAAKKAADGKGMTKERVTTKQKQSAVKKAVGKNNTVRQSTAVHRTEKKTAQAKAAFDRIGKSAQQMAKARAVKKAQKEMVKKSAQTARKVATQTAKFTQKIAAAIVKASAALAKGLIAALGGLVPLIAIITVIAVVAAIIASPFGLFFSGEDNKNTDTVAVSSVVGQLNTEFGNMIEQIQTDNPHDSVEIHGNIADWAEVLAIFAVKTASGEDEATMMDVVTIDSTRVALIKAVFWDMNSLRYEIETITSGEGEDATTTTILHIYIESKSYSNMITAYNFNAQQIEALDGMLQYRDMLIALAGSIEITAEDALAVMERLSPDLSAERRAVVKAACSLVGKVNYFWGGKSTAIGWDSRWGTPTKVTADGSTTTGTIRLFGLDCSGFVTWAFVNAGFDVSAIGHGVSGQNAVSTSISWADAQPGDLAVYSDLSHVGIVAGRDDSGNILVIHCASGHNNVVITGTSGFGFAARPGAYH